MTQENIVNASLLSVGILFLGAVPTVFNTNWIEAVVLALVGVVILTVREVLP